MHVQLFMEAYHWGQTQLLKALNSKFRTKQVSNVILNKSKLPNSLKSEIGISYLKSFNKSEENNLRSVNTYYSHNVFGKQKYLKLRKTNKQAKFQGHWVPSSISYKELAQVINTIDIGISLIFVVITKILLLYIGHLLNSF